MFARTAELQRIVALASAGTSVEVAGTRWSGRTELLHRVQLALSASGITAVMVRGIAGGLPLDAVRSAIPWATQLARGEASSPSGLVALFIRQLEDGPTVLLVDDGNLLDEQSWVAIESAHKRTGTPIVAVNLSGAIRDSASHSVIKVAHPVLKLELTGLGLENLHDLLVERLGGPIAPSATARIHTKSAGIPGFAVAIADAAVESGQLRELGHVWVDSPSLWSNDLDAAFEALLFSYDVPTREAVETLAIVGAVELSTATDLVGEELIESLEGHSLIRLFATRDHHMIAVSPPGIADYFRSRPMSAHRLRILRHIDTVLDDSTTVPFDAAADPAAAAELDSTQLSLVGRMLSESFKLDRAIAWREWERSRCASDAVRVLTLELTGGCNDERLDELVRNPEFRDLDPMVELEFRYLHSRLLVLRGSSLDTIAAALTSATFDYPYLTALASLRIATQIELSGISVEYEAALRDYGEAEDVDGAVARAVLAAALTFDSRAEAALLILDDIVDPFVSRLVETVRGLALFGSGRFTEALNWSTSGVSAAIANGDRAALACHSYIAVITSAALGRFDEASRFGDVVLIAEVRSALVLYSPDRAIMYALAFVASRAGRQAVAQSYMERAELFLGRSEALPFGSLAFAEGAATQMAGDAHGAAVQYRELVGALRESGYQLSADGAAMLALNSEFSEVEARDFRGRARVVGGRLYTAYLDARSASVRKDPAALTSAARSIRDRLAVDVALRHLTHAAKLYRDAGDLNRYAEINAEIRAAVATDGPNSRFAADFLESSWGFTPREQEIVSDIAGGATNIDVAEKYSISVRTVETHVRNIRRKTGVLHRGEIALFASGSSGSSRGVNRAHPLRLANQA